MSKEIWDAGGMNDLLGNVIKVAKDDYLRYKNLDKEIKELEKKEKPMKEKLKETIIRHGTQAESWLFNDDKNYGRTHNTLEGFNMHFELKLNVEYIRKKIKEEEITLSKKNT